MDIVFHYPPELFSLLVDAIPLLFRSKKDVILFFVGSGLDSSFTEDLANQVASEPNSINKYEIVRTILLRLNKRGESALRERREVLKRVGEFEDFSTCWPDDQLKAKGLLAEIRRVVHVKDAFTRMQGERDIERNRHQEERKRRLQKLEQERLRRADIIRDLAKLFSETDPQKRGTSLELVVNRLFDVEGISIRESFRVIGENGQGVIEQIDGVLEIGEDVYLVEMKWLKV
jgi:restriction system protein